MSKLSKIKNIVKSFAKEFGETIEGQGYNLIFIMLEKEEKSCPMTLIDLHRSIIAKLTELQIPNDFNSVRVEIYSTSVNYEMYLFNTKIEAKSPSEFYKSVISLIETKGDDYKKELAEKNRDIAL